MEKEFVTYEQALALKELGFDEPCWAWWHIEDCDTRFCYSEQRSPIINSRETEIVGLPTFSQAFRWFREKHEIHTRINPHSSNDGNDNYIVDEYDWEMVHPKYFDGPYFEKYEDAELDCLKKLIEIVKNKKN